MTNIALLPIISGQATTSQDGDCILQIGFQINNSLLDLTGINFTLYWRLATAMICVVVPASTITGAYLTNGRTAGVVTLNIPQSKLASVPPNTYLADLIATGDGDTIVIGQIVFTHAAMGPTQWTSLTTTARDSATATVAYVPPPVWSQWKGAWSQTAIYAINDVVSSAYSSWISLGAANTGNMPAAGSADWQLVAEGLDPTALNAAVSGAAASASGAGASAAGAAGSASAASASASAAATSAGNAAGSASSAAGVAGNATAAATTATSAAAAGSASAAAAATSATQAATSAGAASASATTATGAAASLTTSLAAFNALYLGSKATDPATDNNGNALASGAEYFNTAEKKLRLYTVGSGWADYDAAAQTDVTNAALSATNAASSAGAAAGSATAAATSATAAAGSASGATTSATNAAASATGAATSATSAASSAAAAQTAAANSNLGTAATKNTGTSGATVPLLNAANTWSASQTFSAGATFGGAISVAGALTGAAATFSGLLTANALSVAGALTASTITAGGNVQVTGNQVYASSGTLYLNYNSSGAVDIGSGGGATTIHNGLTVPGLIQATGGEGSQFAISAYSQTWKMSLSGSNQNFYILDQTYSKFPLAIAPNTSAALYMSGALSAFTGQLSVSGSASVASLTVGGVAVNPVSSSGVRQTVRCGPVSGGAPSFLPGSSSSLTLAAQNVATGPAALVLSAAQGLNPSSAIDVNTTLTANPSWTLTANVTNFLYINTATGAAGVTSLQPLYQFGGTIATASGQFTFDTQAMTGYMGNGSAAVATPLVFVGEAVAGASTITSTIAYAYNGYYDSGYINTLPSAGIAVVKSANIGLADYRVATFLMCLTADQTYSAGAVLNRWITSYSSAEYPIPVNVGRNIFSAQTGGSYTALTFNTSGVNGALTNANWAYRFVVKRTW